MQVLIDAVEKCNSAATLQSWVQRGLKLHVAKQCVGDVLYTPMGYLALEMTLAETEEAEDGTSIDGGRKNVFPLHPSTRTSMARNIQLLQKDKVDVRCLEEVQVLIEERWHDWRNAPESEFDYLCVAQPPLLAARAQACHACA